MKKKCELQLQLEKEVEGLIILETTQGEKAHFVNEKAVNDFLNSPVHAMDVTNAIVSNEVGAKVGLVLAK